ncbi:hypothetical protein [Reyranella sp.]|uniref:hypothetical protein n=1 Tax=Reyranella sp. TaxID=1929291 RepID=UPI002730E05B|nr:hypothetical protein [Reyranella sp.]MDP2377791.1 hypothetical protein [Reyranella sp.]
MAHEVFELVEQIVTGEGSGALACGAASANRLTLAGAGAVNGTTFLGRVEHQSAAEWQLALWTFNPAAGGTITPLLFLKSSTGTPITFAAGTKILSGVEMVAPRIHRVHTVESGSSYAMTPLDYEIIVDKSVAGATAITLPPDPVRGQTVVVSDGKGDAGTNNITVAAAAGNINGLATLVISNNFGTVTFSYTGTQWIAGLSANFALSGAIVVTPAMSPLEAVSGLTYWVDTRTGAIAVHLPETGMVTLADRYNSWTTNAVTVTRAGGEVNGVEEYLAEDPMEITFATDGDGDWQVFQYIDLYVAP